MDEVMHYRQPDSQHSHGDRDRHTGATLCWNHGMNDAASINGASGKDVAGR